MDRPGFTLPKITYLRQAPFVAQAGSCLCTSPAGSSRYVYGLLPNPATTGFANMALFYRYAIGREGSAIADSWQILATPPWTATETIDSGTCLIVDATDGRVWMLTADNAAGPIYHRFRDYNTATDAWTAHAPGGANDLEAVLALAAPITNASLAHPCTALSSLVVTDDRIYAAVGNSANLAAYSKGAANWVAPALAARGGVAAAGSSLDFMIGRPDNLYGLRGGGVGNLDVYTISTNAWATVAATIPVHLFGAGVEVTSTLEAPNVLLLHESGTIYELDRTGALSSIASVAGSDGAAHSGHGLVSWSVGTKRFVGVRLHSKNEWQRIEIVR